MLRCQRNRRNSSKLVGHVGFMPLPVCWRVEHTLAWLGRNRRLAKDYEELPEGGEAPLYVAFISPLLKRLIPRTG
jgi:putative transposase